MKFNANLRKFNVTYRVDKDGADQSALTVVLETQLTPELASELARIRAEEALQVEMECLQLGLGATYAGGK